MVTGFCGRRILGHAASGVTQSVVGSIEYVAMSADEVAIVQRVCGLGDRDFARAGPAALGAGRPFVVRMAPSVRIRAPVSLKSAPRAVRAGRGAPRWRIVRVVVLSRGAAVKVRTCPGPTSAALLRLCDPGTIVQRMVVAACYSQ